MVSDQKRINKLNQDIVKAYFVADKVKEKIMSIKLDMANDKNNYWWTKDSHSQEQKELNTKFTDLQKQSFSYQKEIELLSNALAIERKSLETSRHSIAILNSEIATKQTEVDNSAGNIKRYTDQ